MNFKNQVLINVPLEEVIPLFDNPDNLRRWQEGCVEVEHLSGRPGQPGAKSRLVYQMGKRRIEMIETIQVRNLPEEFSGTYETKGAFNRVTNRFEKVGDNQTLYIAENKFQFTGLMMKLMGLLMPGAFVKQTQKYMDAFKAFAESEYAGSD